ncbi:MAG: thymidine phosphorylase, partial [Kiritimatiellae bacterium]|nr:thymidine phosphorylase [Kiritimatiellia bacterium]
MTGWAMIVKLLLDRKREGGELEPDEIRELVAAYTRGDVPDYQMAAFAMAVCCRGMTAAETHALTDAMQRSGECLTWKGPSADKHSTGGIGDKLSLVIQPLAASCGLSVPSLAGRGLGLTGGTVDKLESIPGYNACLSLDDFRRVVAACGVSIAAQTAEIAPADKKLYALRDVTGTVPSIPLIVGSILSKKLAEGADTLVFDVKCGSGAFMKTRADACALARALVYGAKAAGRKAAALVTAMDEPLGRTVGNALEVEEAIEVLKGGNGRDARCPGDVVELSVELAARMVSLEKGMALDEARAACRANLANGAAYARFAEMVKLHGGDLEAFAARPRGETRVVASSG